MGIDIQTLSSDSDNLAYCGIILNGEQRAALQTSLIVQKEQYKFSKIYFWGKIIGTKEDYFIAQGAGKNELKDKKTLYSHDCIRWKLINPATEESIEKLDTCRGRFTGDPSHEFECKKFKVVGDGDDERIDEEIQTLKEEDRLAAVVRLIDQDTSVVPRGSVLLTPTGEVTKNRLFEGLAINEAAKLSNYFHFREAQALNEKALITKTKLDKAIDFLDSIEQDQPKTSWSLQFERGSALVILRSLKWLGSSFFHVPETRSFGSLYYGIGELNKDIAFML